jgi:hypothetical protein
MLLWVVACAEKNQSNEMNQIQSIAEPASPGR